MRMMRYEEVLKVKEKYIKGTRIHLNKTIEDIHPVRAGEEGVVDFVDDAGQIWVAWDSGRHFPLEPEIDDFSLV